MVKWKLPPKIKIHEALGCIGDKRIEIDGNKAKVYSSSKGKFYTINYDPINNAIMANDNGSYWKGYLGYPSIAFLMLKGVIPYNLKYTEALKEIAWKDLNTKFKNDFVKTSEYVNSILKDRRVNIKEFENEVDSIYEKIVSLKINLLGNKTLPPEGY